MAETPKRTRPRGFAPWNPRRETLALVQDIREVLAEYQAHLPLTIRQTFYRLVATRGFHKTEAAYARLCEATNRARRAGLVPFENIRDDGAARYEVPAWSGADAFLADMHKEALSFRLDRQAGQPVRLWVLCEAGGMAPMLARIACGYGIPVLTSGGFDSVTAKHDLAREVTGALTSAVSAEVLHIGDLDPSGEHLFMSLAEDVAAMTDALCGVVPRFTRLAVTREQAVRLGLPTAPPKATDKRRFTGETVQAEAIDPDTLSSILREAIESRQDRDVAAETSAREADIRENLVAMMEGAI